MAFEYASQFRRYGRNGVIVVTWQEFGLPFCEPLFGLLSVALGASPIAATVKNPERFSTVVTLVQPSAEFFGTAGGDIRQGSLMRRVTKTTVSGCGRGVFARPCLRYSRSHRRVGRRCYWKFWAQNLTARLAVTTSAHIASTCVSMTTLRFSSAWLI